MADPRRADDDDNDVAVLRCIVCKYQVQISSAFHIIQNNPFNNNAYNFYGTWYTYLKIPSGY